MWKKCQTNTKTNPHKHYGPVAGKEARGPLLTAFGGDEADDDFDGEEGDADCLHDEGCRVAWLFVVALVLGE